ncbi:MAG: hypothetical protein J6R82_02395 [Clostridia bacterium]|nr:hypothetical protein [Clostridia bacterium]
MTFTETYLSTLAANDLTPYATPETAAKFETLYTKLIEFNNHTNLTAITDEAGVILRHLQTPSLPRLLWATSH